MSFSTFTKSAFCFFSVTRTESLTSFQAFWTRTPTRCIRKSRRLLGHENVVPFLSRPEFYRLFSPANLKLKLQKYGFLLLQKFICSHHMYPLFLKRCCSIIPLIFYFYHFFYDPFLLGHPVRCILCDHLYVPFSRLSITSFLRHLDSSLHLSLPPDGGPELEIVISWNFEF